MFVDWPVKANVSILWESCAVNLLSALEIKLPKISENGKFFGSDNCSINIQFMHLCIVAIENLSQPFMCVLLVKNVTI